MAEAKINVTLSDLPEVKAALEAAAERIEAAEALAAGVRSFLSSLPFQPPEAVGFQANAKLVPALDYYESTLVDLDA